MVARQSNLSRLAHLLPTLHKRYHPIIELQRHTGYGVVTFRKPLTDVEAEEEKKLLQAKSSNGIINTNEEEILIGVALKCLSIPQEQTLVRLSKSLTKIAELLGRHHQTPQ